MEQEVVKTVRIVIDSRGAKSGGEEVENALASIDSKVAGIKEAMAEKFASIGNLFKGLIAAFTVEKIVERFAAIAEAMDALQRQAERMRVTTDWLQEFQLAAVTSGVKVADATTALDKFARAVGNAALGNKEAVDTMRDLNLKILDSTGHVRPMNDLFVEAARRITGMSDAAKANALSIQTMGRQAQAVMPMLERVAELRVGASLTQSEQSLIPKSFTEKLDGGNAADRSIADMQRLASANASIVSPDVVGRWASLTTAFEKLMLEVRNFVASNFIGVAELAFKGFEAVVRGLLLSLQAVISAFQTIKNLFEQNTAPAAVIAGLEQGIAQREAVRDRAAAYMQKPFQAVSNFPGVDVSNPQGQVNQLNQEIAAMRGQADDLRRQQTAQGHKAARGDELYKESPLTPPGAGAAFATEADRGTADRINKETDALKAAAAAQDLMTAAARKGDVAFIEQEAHVEALQKAISIYGGKLDATNPRVVALADDLEKLIKRSKEGKAAETFLVGTTELQQQNALLEAQLRLMNEAPEVQARELAIIKAKQEALKAGKALTDDDVAARKTAIEQNEKLKIQAEQMKQANELWTEPLKQAFRNIQTAGADAWEKILETGNFTFQSLGDVAVKTFRRMAAEFLALATIRPVLQIAVEAIGPGGLGLIGGNTAAQLGFPVGAGGSGNGTSSSGGRGSSLGGFSMPGGFGGGGGGGLFNPGFLQTPMFGGIDSEIANWSSYGTSAQGAAGLFSGAATYGQALGGLASVAGIGLGAYTLANAKGAGGIASGISGILGGGLGLAALAFPALAGTLGPIGIGIGLAGMLAGSLLGDGGPQIPKQPPLAYGMGNFYATGGRTYTNDSGALNGGTGLDGSPLGSAVMGYFRSAGLSPVAGRLIGGELASGVDHQLNGNQWSDRPYTQIGLVGPGGGLERLTYNDSSRNTQQAGEMLVAQVVRANVLRGGVSGAGAGLTAGLRTINPTTQADLENVLAMGSAYDRLGKAQNTVKEAIDKLGGSFDELRDFATKAGLSLEPINAELAKQTKRTAQDFIDGMLDPLAVQMRALDDERASALESAQYIKDNIEGVYVDINKITDYYGKKRLALEDQFYAGGISNLQDAIKRLTYGDLANASPDTALAGIKASYTAGLAQAQAGDPAAIANLANLAIGYAQAQQQYSGSGPDYVAVQARILAQLQNVVGKLDHSASGGGSAGGAQQINQASATLIAANDQLREIVQTQSDQITDLKNMVSALTAQMSRIATNRL